DNLTRRRDRLNEFKTGLLPPLLMILLSCGLLLLQPDLSSAVLVFVTAFTMFLIGGVSGKQLLLTLLILIPLTLLAIYSEPYRWARITAFVDPWAVSDAEGYQAVQSLLAIGSGGLTGVGLGASTQKLFYLPEAHTDFIFSILTEELGLLGPLVVVALFAGLIIIGLKIAKDTNDSFGRLLAVGITTWLGVQAIFNLGVVTALLPTTGLPLPFISYGGTSLVISLAAVGILGNIARQAASGAIAPAVRSQGISPTPTASFTRRVTSRPGGVRVYNPPADNRRRWS
ncbi:putative lipid II flippase FtsW, partial [bacterium]|nr:putative lipid II flippase FtsW [bacterium]